MEYKILPEKKRQRDIVKNTLKACRFLQEYIIENMKCYYAKNHKIATMTELRDMLKELKSTQFDGYGNDLDSKALDIKLFEIHNCFKNHMIKEDIKNINISNDFDYYTISGSITIFEDGSIKIPKLNFLKLHERHKINKTIQSKYKNMKSTIVYRRNEYFVIFDEKDMTSEITAKEKTIEDNEWDQLYQYVKKEIMKFDDNMKLSDQMVLRLKGLSQGQVLANRNIDSKANYTYKELLLTFKYCKLDIERIVRTKIFKSDIQRFSYISKIVEGNITDVVNKIKYVKKQEDEFKQGKLKNIDISTSNTKANYKRRTKEVTNSRLKDLW